MTKHISHMFNSFDPRVNTDIPDNVHPKKPCPHFIHLNNNPLNYIYDSNNKLTGYSWDYGEIVSIPVSVNVTVRVYWDSIVSDIIGQEPPDTGEFRLGQSFYNTVDVKSWSYTYDGWVQDGLFTYPSDGTMPIDITPVMFGKTTVVKIKNFRHEDVFTYYYEDVNDFTVDIDLETSKKLVKGVYIMDITVNSEHSNALISRYEIQVY